MDRSAFYASLRARNSGVFGTSIGQSQVVGMEELLNEAQDHGVPLRQLAYILGGVYHETGGKMVPVREGFASTDAGARRIVAKRSYGKPAGPYGHVYYGRGRIQNTWLDNMEKLTKRFGIDFVKSPDLLLDPATDALVTVVGHLEGIWTGKKLSDYIVGEKADYPHARQIVNGMDKSKDIAGYAEAFATALRAAGYIGQAPAKPIAIPPDPVAPPVPVVPVEAPVVVSEPVKKPWWKGWI